MHMHACVYMILSCGSKRLISARMRAHVSRLCNYASLLFETGENEAAELLYRRAVAADPSDAVNLCMLGNLLRETKKDVR
jgi:hypothetical protein